MKKLGMGALLGVGQGSSRESQLVTMQWNGGKKGGKPVAFVGKGVCFDTGGISIKPAAGMEEMKWDMGGAGAVIGAMAARSEEHTSELQSLMRISYAVFCLKKKKSKK